MIRLLKKGACDEILEIMVAMAEFYLDFRHGVKDVAPIYYHLILNS